MIWLIILYCIAVCLAVLLALQAADKARVLSIPSALSGCIITAGMLYISCLIPGVAGLLYVPVIYILFIVLAGVSLLMLFRFRPKCFPFQTDIAPFSFSDYVLTLAGLLAAYPLLKYVRWDLFKRVLYPEKALNWDTVSYHLPGFIEYLQAHSFWSLDGPYQSYSYAFEIIGNFLSMPFHAHWGLILSNVFAIVLLILAVCSVARTLVSQLPLKHPAGWIPCSAITVGIWSVMHAEDIADVGKNDIFMTACLTAALAFLLELAVDKQAVRARRDGLILLTGMSAGLALATKPSALAFIPFFAGAVWLESLIRKESRRRSVFSAGAVLLLSGLLGGFWLIRNLIVFRSLSPVAGGWNLSLFANLHNPALYEIKTGSILFVLAALAAVPVLVCAAVFRFESKPSFPLLLFGIFHLTACGAYTVTPHAIFQHDLTCSLWQLRLGMPLFVSAALIAALLAVYAADLFSACGDNVKAFLFPVPVLLVVLAIACHWSHHPAAGLPGYEDIRGLPRTEVYRWVQQQPEPLRIYSAGLRPYGLYGPHWRNRLFYDLHSTDLSPLETGKLRIAAVTVRFKPDLILISVDPHFYSGNTGKPEPVKWMREQTNCFEEVFCDEAVSGFRVRDGAAELLKASVPSECRRMILLHDETADGVE